MKKKNSALRIARVKKDDGGSISSPNFVQATHDLQLTSQEQALYQRHLANLNGSGGVDNDGSNPSLPAGSRSTLFQTTMQNPDTGQFHNVPTVWNGKVEANFDPSGQFQGISDQGAANVKAAGINSFPAYNSEDEAEARYQQMHNYMDKDTGQYFQNKAANMPTGDEIQPMRGGGKVGLALRIAKADGGGVFSGYIPGTTGGRTDNKPISVADGSFVVPADILSGLGEGNSHAGWASLQAQFGMDIPAKADGGAVGQPVPIVAASGEGVIDPDTVAKIGGGDLDRGHGILNALVKHVRSRTIKSLKRLPSPKRN